MAENPKKLPIFSKVAIGSVALASAGLTTCNFGAVDPAPPPLDCHVDAGGVQLTVTGVVQADILTVKIRPTQFGASSWNNPTASSVTGATLISGMVSAGDKLEIEYRFQLPPGGGTRMGSFQFTGGLADYRSTQCSVAKLISFTVDSSNRVTISRRESLPMEARHAASIALLEHTGDEVSLRATTKHPSPRRIEWSVSAGEILSQQGDRARWRLPSTAGLYQVELVIDYDDDGFAFDTLTLEVG